MGKASLDYVAEFVSEENIDCEFEITGRFHGAHSEKAFEQMSNIIDEKNPVFNSDAYLVSKHEQHQELGTDYYHGGMVFPHYAAVHPAKYHAGILKLVKEAGATVIGHNKVESIKPVKAGGTNEQGHVVQCTHGTVKASKVVLATNGYTGSLSPWQQRRVIPIGSYIIATEEIDAEQMQHLFPTRRMLTDSRKLVYYYRPSSELHRLFPALADVRISHSWAGTVAYTFDSLMHCGEQDGLHYAMGYCGSGVGMASYLGKCIGQQISSTGEMNIPLAKIPFKTRPLYQGTPWFLAPSVWLYRMRDRTGW